MVQNLSKICQQYIFLLQITTRKMHISLTFLLRYCRNCSVRDLSFFWFCPIIPVYYWYYFGHPLKTSP